ncbi:MAG: hypothetical protein JW981_09770 [Anaerolineae bacterium]|nr:hypothetical protein [Anaerolineae bacterium]
MIYKVSYVILGGQYPGGIMNQDTPPEIGAEIQIGPRKCEVLEVQDLLPPQGGFAYLHVTCRVIEENNKAEK